MQVLNIHKRIIIQPKDKIADLFETLATREDKVWPIPAWPRMKLDRGLEKGSKGGHGPVRYTVLDYTPREFIQFKFTSPKGFHGVHQFELSTLVPDQTELKHTIKMKTAGSGTLAWIFAIRWLHDALVEDALDKVENHFGGEKKKTKWNLWVKILRSILNPKKSRS